MKANQVMAGDDGTAIITRKEDVKGSFAHLRTTAAIGPDRRSLVNFYKTGHLGQVAPHYPEETTSIGETDEVYGSIDKGIVSSEWEEALSELSLHVDPDVWPALATRFVQEFEQTCRDSTIDYRLWHDPPAKRFFGWWDTRISGCIRMFGTPGDCLPNPWIPRGPLPDSSHLSAPELCKRLTHRYVRYLQRIQYVSLYDCIAFQADGRSAWGRLYALGYAFRRHQIEKVLNKGTAGFAYAGENPVSEREIEKYICSDGYAAALYDRQSSFFVFILAMLAVTTLLTQLLLPGIMMYEIVITTTSFGQLCADTAPLAYRGLSMLLSVCIVVFGTFPKYAANDYMTHDIYLHSYALTNRFIWKLGRIVNGLVLHVVIPVVMVYLLYKNPGLDFLLFNAVAVVFLAHIDNYAAQVYEQIYVHRTGSRGLTSHIKGKLLLEYLINGSRINRATRRALGFRLNFVGFVLRNVFVIVLPVAVVAYGLVCLPASTDSMTAAAAPLGQR